MAELDMSWVTEEQVVADPLAGKKRDDVEGFEL
jgi:hypothetical protein